MNLRKHVAGFALFSAIIGCAVLINAYLNPPVAAVPPVQVNDPSLRSSIDPVQVPTVKVQPVSYRVGQVLINLDSDKSYTELQLTRLPGQPAPERLWVTTYFFSPAYPDKVWTARTEIRQPFARNDQTSFLATDICCPCLFIKTLPAQRVWAKSIYPRSNLFEVSPPVQRSTNTGFFARVLVSTDSAEPDTSGEHLDRNISGATPVVIEWPEAWR